LSITVDGFWESLLSGRSGVRPYVPCWRTLCPLPIAAPALFCGDIDEFDVIDLVQRKAIKKGLKLMSREIQMAVAATSRALNHAEIYVGQLPPDRVGISFGSDYILTTVEDVIDAVCACSYPSGQKSGNSFGQFDFRRWGKDGLSKMQPLWQLKYLPNMPASHIAILNNFHGPSNSITLREASVGAVVAESVSIIASGRTDVMVAGTTGGWLHPCKLISALRNEEISNEICRPFDLNRNGTNLGDGAAAIILEEHEHAKKRGAKIWCEIIAGSCKMQRDRQNTDYKREVVRRVIKDVLKYSALRNNEFADKKNKKIITENENTLDKNNNNQNKKHDKDIEYAYAMEIEQIGHINAHGLGSKDSDKAEALAINDVFGGRSEPTPVVAAKGFWGNSGAGTGMFELIASIIALKTQKLFPSINHKTTDPNCPITIAEPNKHKTGNSFIKIAINPQGHASAILAKKEKE
jgi:3-oxoacyl-[acyl-carrier-protein] synthase II